jgi:hypothetical protein
MARARRFVVALAFAASLASAAVGCGGDEQAAPSRAEGRPSVGASTPATATARPAELPRGGRTVFPEHRLVGYAGSPKSRALGRLGVGDLDARAREIETLAKPYAQGRRILPVLELIATVAHRRPGPDGTYRERSSDAVIRRYLAAARRVDGLLLLNIQPGRADFLPEVQAYERWLREPDVGLALDPEWAVGPGQVPGRVFGRTSGRELDSVASYVSGLVRRYDLPEKVLVYHQLHRSVVRDEGALRAHEGVALVKSVDGIGARRAKEETWRKVTSGMPKHVHGGFKLFLEEDAEHGPLMTPAQVLRLRPTPEYVLYE